MPVVSISIPSDLFHELEERKAKRSRSGAWTDYLKLGTKMEGHRCPELRKPKWPDDHRCPQSVGEYFAENLKKFGEDGWVQTSAGRKFSVTPKEE